MQDRPAIHFGTHLQRGGEVQYTVGIIGMLRSTHSDEFRAAVQRVCATATMISAALGYRNQEDSL